MKQKAEWIDLALLKAFAAEGIDAHRLCTIEDGWVERFGREILISYKNPTALDQLTLELYIWRKSVEFDFLRIFTRFLPKKNEEREKPRLVFGDEVANLETIAVEHFLNYAIDFEAGYSVGFFIDQRENRRHLRLKPARRVLNCFAYTCSFSVAAASVGAETVNIDLSRKSLERGRRNFGLNSLPTSGHKFIADDVLSVLPRMARRGEKFDVIILDPPTFSRSHRGSIFHVENDFEKLLATALEVIDRDGRILLSTNCTSLTDKTLEVMGRYCLKLSRKAGRFLRAPSLPDFSRASGASTVWLTLR